MITSITMVKKLSFTAGVPSNHQHFDRLQLFCELATQYQDFAFQAGVQVVPYYDSEPRLFSQQSSSKQHEILEALALCVKVCRDTEANGHALCDSPQLIWQALKELGLRPPSDLFSYMNDCTVVEVYSPEGIQIFRSFSFFRYCSYSLEELYCENWTNLFARDDETIVPMIFNFMRSVYDGTEKCTTSLRHVPQHIVRETSSPERLRLKVGVNWGAPLFRENTMEPVATLFLETGELIARETPTRKNHLKLHSAGSFQSQHAESL